MHLSLADLGVRLSAGEIRDRALNVILDTALTSDALIIVGNGDLARRVGAMHRYTPAILLEGSMGMACAVAVGYLNCCSRSVVVVEGDGNRLMGSPADVWLSVQKGHALHVVFVNGIYASSGAQPVPIDLNIGSERAQHCDATDITRLNFLLSGWANAGGITRLLIHEAKRELRLPPRPQQGLRASVAQVISESLQRRQI